MIAVQHGVISRPQALTLGMTDTMIRRRVGSGVWTSLWSGVYSPAATAESWHRRLMGACLAVGPRAAASHRSAGALWQLRPTSTGIVEVTIAGGGGRRLDRVILHRTRSLPVADRTTVDGIPVTRPARTLIDLAAVLALEDLEDVLDCGLRERLVSVDYLDRRLAELGSRGRNGVELLRELVADRRGSQPADSRAENRVRRDLVAAGLPKPVRQYVLRDGGIKVAEFDLAFPPERIGIEFDSYRFHADKRTWRRDQAKHNHATAMGWLVFHLTADSDVGPVVHAYRDRAAA